MISKLVVSNLSKIGIPLSKMAFFSVDQAPSLCGVKNGAIKFLKEKVPHLTTMICSCHSLNSSIDMGMKFGPIGESLRLANRIVNFFNSPKRTHYMDSVQKLLGGISKTRRPTQTNADHRFILIYCSLSNLNPD